ncbi:nucleotidyltransferase family protein [Cognatiyoonia sp. IB215446]|uniref:nucleotidyltransferase family protein n=1 Tax=Cognatiyoonia sp. IB215446 TaxID=3097355 RepID=UPI002A181CF7|nr:nucleotidyltransferase family protein [Cognatiyoonia sp. IB215446]MDX8347349.1 nucleotidyltransferase family protein [Cognatiyoonia sp. IB215446]
MHSIAAILLAAGLSSRMGPQNKLLLDVEGEPLVRRVARAYLSVLDGPLTVVTGFEAEQVRTVLNDLPVHFAHNAAFAGGQPGSVATGLKHAPEAELLAVGLGDQPLLTPYDLTKLIAAQRAGDSKKITIPVHAGQRGNPIIVPRALRHRLTENPARPGCMRFTRDHPEHVQAAELDARGFYADVGYARRLREAVRTRQRGRSMTRTHLWLRRLLHKLKMTPEQADNIRFPCC